MRLSIFENNSEEYYNVEVYLHGKKLKNCVIANEELGEAWVYIDLKDVPAGVTEIPIRKRTGKVEIRGYNETNKI